MTRAAVVVAGGLGAALRYLTGTLVQTRLSTEFPWGTAVVNTIGAFVLGGVAGIHSDGWGIEIASGFIAGFTTFSTWMIEVVYLWLEGRRGRVRALIDLAGLAAVGVLAAALGFGLSEWLV